MAAKKGGPPPLTPAQKAARTRAKNKRAADRKEAIRARAASERATRAAATRAANKRAKEDAARARSDAAKRASVTRAENKRNAAELETLRLRAVAQAKADAAEKLKRPRPARKRAQEPPPPDHPPVHKPGVGPAHPAHKGWETRRRKKREREEREARGLPPAPPSRSKPTVQIPLYPEAEHLGDLYLYALEAAKKRGLVDVKYDRDTKMWTATDSTTGEVFQGYVVHAKERDKSTFYWGNPYKLEAFTPKRFIDAYLTKPNKLTRAEKSKYKVALEWDVDASGAVRPREQPAPEPGRRGPGRKSKKAKPRTCELCGRRVVLKRTTVHAPGEGHLRVCPACRKLLADAARARKNDAARARRARARASKITLKPRPKSR